MSPTTPMVISTHGVQVTGVCRSTCNCHSGSRCLWGLSLYVGCNLYSCPGVSGVCLQVDYNLYSCLGVSGVSLYRSTMIYTVVVEFLGL